MDSTPMFNPGDTVRLNSGSPIMSVVGYRHGMVMCKWWDGKTFQTEDFAEQSLIKEEPYSPTFTKGEILI